MGWSLSKPRKWAPGAWWEERTRINIQVDQRANALRSPNDILAALCLYLKSVCGHPGTGMRGFASVGAAALVGLTLVAAAPSFVLDNDRFVLDGEAVSLRAGCVHYSRIHESLWDDRLARLAAMGANAVEVYVFWNFHEAQEGVYDWDGSRDLAGFLRKAQSHGLLVLLRAGPYGCGEWEFGGFPAWLIQKPNVTIRTYNDAYLAAADKWWTVLLGEVVQPLLYSNGGPVVMVQVENEYGSYGDVSSNPLDRQYMEHLVHAARQHLGNDVILYTTDGGDASFLTRGTLNGSSVYSVGDFGPGSDPETHFQAAAAFNPPGMQVPFVSEFYSGWLTHWGEKMANTSSVTLASYADKILAMNGSLSLYMGHGGTNFGWWSGANGGGSSFSPTMTSYDYDAPVSEGGGHGYGPDGDKFAAVQQVFRKYASKPLPAAPPGPFTAAYGSQSLVDVADLLDDVGSIASAGGRMPGPAMNAESVGCFYGFALYSTVLSDAASRRVGAASTLCVSGVRDRAHVFINGEPAGIVYRPNAGNLSVTVPPGARLDVLVENMGRLNYGKEMWDPKGIRGGVWLDGVQLSGWNVSCLSLSAANISKASWQPWAPNSTGVTGKPRLYRGTLSIPESQGPVDTYVSSRGWNKGALWINGFNLGRFWEAQGPQHTLYVPANVMTVGSNVLYVLELDGRPDETVPPMLDFVDAPDFSNNGPKPCVAGVTPSAGINVATSTCNSALETLQTWDVISGSQPLVQLHGSQLCLQAGPGHDPSSGAPNVALAVCGNSAAEAFRVDAAAGTLTTDDGKMCLDITNHLAADGANVETYPCNGGTNQQWVYDAETGAVTSKQDGRCLTACSQE